MPFYFSNTEIIRNGNKKTIRKVFLDGKKGYKCVSKYYNGKLKKTAKKNLKPKEKTRIKMREFIPELFDDCICII